MTPSNNPLPLLPVKSNPSITALAQREGFDLPGYAIVLSDRLRNLDEPLDHQRERLKALAGLAPDADKACAEELAAHYAILIALFERFSRRAVQEMEGGKHLADQRAATYLNTAAKAQRAALACLSALKAVRDNPTPPLPPQAAPSLLGQ